MRWYYETVGDSLGETTERKQARHNSSPNTMSMLLDRRRKAPQDGPMEQPERSPKRPRHQPENLLKTAGYLESSLQIIPPTATTTSLGTVVQRIRDKKYSPAELTILRMSIKAPLDSPSEDIANFVAVANQYRSDLAELYSYALGSSTIQSNHEETDELIRARQKAIEDGREAPAPSEAAKHSNLSAEQTRRPMKIGRPFETTGLPLSLYHHVFSDFQTDTQDPNFEHNPEDEVFAYELITIAAKVHSSEQDHVSLMRTPLGTLLKRTIGGAAGDKIGPDGIIYQHIQREEGDIDVPLLIMEVKNEVGTGGSDPEIQASFYFRKLWTDPLSLKKIQNVCCCPSFILSVAGPNITILGGVLTTEFIVQPLTEPVKLANLPDPFGRAEHIAKIMAALRKGLTELEKFYNRLDPADEEQSARFAPSFQEYAGSTLTYTTPNLLSDRIGRGMFDAMVKGPGEEEGSPVKVKFTPRYCNDAHTLLAEKNLAPKLRHFEELKNGWKVVVMDIVAGPDLASVNLTDVPLLAFNEIKQAIDVLHEADLVFGDLRRPNIMLCKRGADEGEDGAMLVDFDWAGKQETQRYPPVLNPNVKWAKGIKAKGRMLKKHDLDMFALLKSDWESSRR